ncbi:AIR carboxylase [Maioricimonas rarisocia]|uniref:AIR carboxylase n=1 Tax=Maioricimonas rarisocia TaxID=2528026 RepID=A0A517Z7U6_9PLAN|nr:nickel pincer cofactor biosynthesis protein LarB [Maioricimonas rarisocia]QDU38547.1 AIR carboxylase [Maioricimonas rarisocia]
MTDQQIRDLFEGVASGRIQPNAAAEQVAHFTAANAGRTAPLTGVRLDLDRARRCGFPEVVYGPGKSSEALVEIFGRLRDERQAALATRVTAEQADSVCSQFSDVIYNAQGRTLRLPGSEQPSVGRVLVITAGTSDRNIAEEALETLAWMHVSAELLVDVGVAGPHRLIEHLDRLDGLDAVVVVAGMEGALPSVVGGWVDCPVIGVPTSVGYGAALGGMAALLGMLNSCASNVTVVNIDAGFKGAYIAGMIAKRRHDATSPV